jgi:hypothetical protein
VTAVCALAEAGLVQSWSQLRETAALVGHSNVKPALTARDNIISRISHQPQKISFKKTKRKSLLQIRKQIIKEMMTMISIFKIFLQSVRPIYMQ